MAAATLGAGSVPVLPVEIRRHVWEMRADPPKPATPCLWCSVCGVAVLQYDGEYQLVHYRHWDDVVRCLSCVGHPRV